MKRKNDSSLRVLRYGFAASQVSTADAFVAKQYGFSYYPVTGCVITKPLMDSIDSENNRVYRVLAQKHGAKWKEEYINKVDSLTAIFEQVKEIVSKEPFIQKINRQHTGGIIYHVAPADSANGFNVKAFTADAHRSYTFRVNLHTRRVERTQ